MSDAEVGAFLREQRVVAVATNGRDGWPHVMPLWYTVRDEHDVWIWTYAASQKVRNIERDPRATLSLETGERYEELRGVMLRAQAEIERDSDLVKALGTEIYSRYMGTLADDVVESIARQAPKRVGIRFAEVGRATWDHRKLA
ncbi:MAG TPA: TIGR03618 family F420-dependent PPOX class oxidoreductase [Solirubrobacteraceae bacterium]|jgi:PPOX class probable F420-dependent enzyme|nr:TIGR03618 family F420-dependent PPOX class oxidoreductase [Solirubrobacteraceae bacterium]